MAKASTTIPPLSRRYFFGTAGAVAAGGALFAMPATSTAHPFALGGRAVADDPIVALLAERRRIFAACEASGEHLSQAEFNANVGRCFEATDAIAERVSGMTATSAAGLIAQIRLLARLEIDNEAYDTEPNEKLVASLIAGIERLVPGGAA